MERNELYTFKSLRMDVEATFNKNESYYNLEAPSLSSKSLKTPRTHTFLPRTHIHIHTIYGSIKRMEVVA